MKKKILVLGASGFIGRNTAEYFAQREEMEVYGTYFKSSPLSHPKIKMLHADLTKKEEVDSVIKGMDVVIQSAAITSGIKDVAAAPQMVIADNAVMNSLIFRSAFDHSIPHVFTLSCTVMYHSSDLPLKETDFDANRDMYPSYFGVAWNKVYFEKMGEFYASLGRNKYTTIRHSNVYGPYDKYDLERSHFFGATVTKVLTATEDKLTMWGTGEEERDLLHVEDLIRFIELAIEKQETMSELYNVGSGSSFPIKDLVSKIIECSGKTMTVVHDMTKPSNKTKVSLNCDKAKTELGWEPKLSLESGIQKTIEWYRKNLLN
jgi:GDP-L-fucose synthase